MANTINWHITVKSACVHCSCAFGEDVSFTIIFNTMAGKFPYSRSDLEGQLL